jgi:hypothetical protein
MKREKTLEFVMSFPGWWKGNFFWKRLGIYILWNGTYYKERIEICALENVYLFSQIFMGLEEIP